MQIHSCKLKNTSTHAHTIKSLMCLYAQRVNNYKRTVCYIMYILNWLHVMAMVSNWTKYTRKLKTQSAGNLFKIIHASTESNISLTFKTQRIDFQNTFTFAQRWMNKINKLYIFKLSSSAQTNKQKGVRESFFCLSALHHVLLNILID